MPSSSSRHRKQAPVIEPALPAMSAVGGGFGRSPARASGDARRRRPGAGAHAWARRLLRRCWSLGSGLLRLAGAGRRGLRLTVGRRALTFRGLAEFEFMLAPKTELPVGRIGELMACSAEDLERAAVSIRHVENRLTEALAATLKAPARIDETLRTIETRIFSQDHEWRSIIEGLAALGPGSHEYKRLALVRYIQYLGSRQEVLQSIYAVKTRAAPAAAGSGAQVPSPNKLLDTAIFDLTQVGATRTETSGRPRAVRLPRGETVEIALPAGGSEAGAEGAGVEIFLARHRLVLEANERSAQAPMLLRLEDGTPVPLRRGENLIGRHAECDVVVDAGYRAVSRKHVVIEPRGARRARITDLSSHGTLVAPEALK